MKRTLSFVLCLAFIFSMFGSVLVGTAGAAAYKDLPANHWAVNEISYMSEKSGPAGLPRKLQTGRSGNEG